MTQAAPTLLRRPKVQALTGLSTSALYALKAKGEFPQPVKLTARAVGWHLRDIEAWIESRQSAAAVGAANA